MHSFPKVVEGRHYKVCFFSGISGHQHPYTPSEPLPASEAYAKGRRTFYLGWYAVAGSTPQLRRLEKYWLVHTETHAREAKPNSIRPGVYYYRVNSADGRLTITDPVSVKDTLYLQVFYVCRTTAAGEVGSSYVLRKHLMDRYIYSYAPNGSLDDVGIEVYEVP